MYIRNIWFILLAFGGAHMIGGAQVLDDTQSTEPSWIYGSLGDTGKDNKHNLHHQYPTQQIPISEYPSEYTPYYPPQYTPPYPTQGKPQNKPPFKPPFTSQNHLQPTAAPPPPLQHPHHTQIWNPSIKPTTTSLPPTSVLEQYNYRYPDGSYEFRYELPDETVRYERGYFIYFHHKKSIVVRGFYSYPIPGRGFLTVFYTADHYGYRQDSSGITQHRPQLPRSLGERRILPDEEAVVEELSSINENKLE